MLSRFAPLIYYIYTYVRDGHTAKKHAKVLLFFDMTKLFRKKIQKKFILHDLLGILHI